MAKISYCDAYEIVDIHEVNEDYVEERKSLIEEYEKTYGNYEDNFMSGYMATISSIKSDLEFRKNSTT